MLQEKARAPDTLGLLMEPFSVRLTASCVSLFPQEKAKLRRARERAKQKALLKKQQEQQLTEAAGPSGSGTSSPLPLQPAGEDEEGCYSLPHQGSPSPPAAESPTKTSQLKGRRRFV